MTVCMFGLVANQNVGHIRSNMSLHLRNQFELECGSASR